MNIHITGRHIDVTAAQKDLIESKLSKLERLIDGIYVEEAVAEIDGGGAEFLVFRNALNDRVNVIYRRRDGNYGLIDPGGQ